MNIEEAKKTVDKLSVCGSKIGDIPTVKTHIVKLLLEQLDQPKLDRETQRGTLVAWCCISR
ncbi:hypothetical protein ScFU6_19740 [Streptococcus canis]|nr:hypothetical protein [Streptococcus canis]GFE46205.1 hypothetical protein ScFU6_19740 [Streptococcus canis]